MATIGGFAAVADLRGLRLSGFAAWAFRLALHLYYLIGFENRLIVLSRWAAAYFARSPGARLITAAPRPCQAFQGRRTRPRDHG